MLLMFREIIKTLLIWAVVAVHTIHGDPCTYNFFNEKFMVFPAIHANETLPTIAIGVERDVTENFWIGFGISPEGAMIGADLFIVEVKNRTVDKDNGFKDYHGGEFNGPPVFDSEQNDNWLYPSAYVDEDNNFITIFVNKMVNPPNIPEDIKIENKDQFILVALGKFDENGEIEQHDHRDFLKVNLMDQGCGNGTDEEDNDNGGTTIQPSLLTRSFPLLSLFVLIICSFTV